MLEAVHGHHRVPLLAREALPHALNLRARPRQFRPHHLHLAAVDAIFSAGVHLPDRGSQAGERQPVHAPAVAVPGHVTCGNDLASAPNGIRQSSIRLTALLPVALKGHTWL